MITKERPLKIENKIKNQKIVKNLNAVQTNELNLKKNCFNRKFNFVF